MKTIYLSISGLCAIAIIISGPLAPALTHASMHAITDAHQHSHQGSTHSHEHDESSKHHELLMTDVQPAALTRSPSLDLALARSGQPFHSFSDSAYGGPMPPCTEFFNTGPPLKSLSLLLARAPSDRAPPA